MGYGARIVATDEPSTELGLPHFVDRLRRLLPILSSKYHVRSLALFGSYVRQEQTGDSDLDILVEFDEPPSLIEFMRLETLLTEFLGVKVDLGTKAALKFLPEELSRDKHSLDRFEREAKLLASLNHPNIAAIHGMEQADGKPLPYESRWGLVFSGSVPRQCDSQHQIQGIKITYVWEREPAYSSRNSSCYGTTAHPALPLFQREGGNS